MTCKHCGYEIKRLSDDSPWRHTKGPDAKCLICFNEAGEKHNAEPVAHRE